MTDWKQRLSDRRRRKTDPLSANLLRETRRQRDEAEAIEELEHAFAMHAAVVAGEACPICHGPTHDDGLCPLRSNQ